MSERNQSTDDENVQTKSDPNLVGSAQAVRDDRAARFTTMQDEDKYVPEGADWTDTEFYRGR
jgi:hypothetical protein